MNEEERKQWQERRDVAAEERAWKDAGGALPCVRQQMLFGMAERGIEEAVRQAKLVCNTACPFLDLCKNRTLRIETGLRGYQRSGIVAGMTGTQRAKEARRRGCGICGAKLSDDSSRQALYCAVHGVRGAREKALEGIAS